ncbi:MAG: 2-succinyl-5-enolpyruvyl-6-hydroxy-3-cyclohexene-1-carboxylic-acid synthase [Micrococcales bacterium]
MMTAKSPAQVFAAELLVNLAAATGARHIFLSPGSRSQALAVAAEQLASAGQMRLHVRLDERSSGFGALGTALASQSPAIVITTSGTAVANLHPAVLEAHHSGVPLILLTADRPSELRGVGANQTTDQPGIFGSAVPTVFDIEAPELDDDHRTRAVTIAEATGQALLATPGPIQLNLAFREPLSSSEPNATTIQPTIGLIEAEQTEVEWAILEAKVPTVVIAGAGATDDAIELAESFGWPVFAEPSSGARFGANAIIGYRRLLEHGHPLVNQIGRVVVFGKPTLSRKVNALFFNEAIEMIVVESKTHGRFDPAHRVAKIVNEISVDDEVDFGWLSAWREADVSTPFVFSDKLDRANLIRLTYQASETSDSIVFGASRLIRDADLVAPAKPILIFANRGLAGIDGTIATATGVALANSEYAQLHHETQGYTRAVMGDLTALHDISSLAIDRNDDDINLQVIVGNDNGGTIFTQLEVASQVDDQTLARVFTTPQQVDFWHVAQAYGWQYERVSTLDELQRALELSGRVLIEVLLVD